MNREMLKEAIAEAKTIKETAIANAKAALEEAFTPQLTAMFAERLNEEDEEEKMQKENYSMEEEELEEDFNLEEILAELSKTEETDEGMKTDDTMEGLDEDLMLEEMSDEEIEELVMKVIDDMIETGKLMPGEGEEEEDLEDVEDLGGEEDVEIDDDDVELDELLNELMGDEKDEVNEVSNYVDDYLNNQEIIIALASTLGITALAAKDYIKAAFQSLGGKAKKAIDKLTETAEVAETPEMEETIAELRNELNEVNLLNAKLLYTNKIFKAKNLTESEKIKVLNTFDKAETVKEVKLVFETLTESFKATAKKAPIKESLGSASRSIASTQTKQPIIEVNDAFARMQKLAGLRK
jgi:hypothetical protein